MECAICCENFTKQTRKKIECPSSECSESCCSKCFKTYLLEGGNLTPKCMFCTKDISYSFVRDTFPRSWINKEYLEFRTLMLLAREKTLLPESQQDVREELEKRERAKQCNEIDLKINYHLSQITKLENEAQKIRNFRPRVKHKDREVSQIRCGEENCKGYIGEGSKCGMCGVKTCDKCGEKKNDDHICDEEIIKSYKAIKSDTRPCPKCSIRIHKWEGCNQMYCTQCGCMFDYSTGRLETGLFHNPHYYDAVRNGTLNNTLHRNNCGRFNDRLFVRMSSVVVRYILSLNYSKNTPIVKGFRNIQNITQLANHISEVSLQNYSPNVFDNICRKSRKLFLMDEITEDEWIKTLKSVEKKREKNKEIYQLLELFRDVSRDVAFNMYTIYNNKSTVDLKRDVDDYLADTMKEDNSLIALTQYIKSMDEFTEFTNDKFETLSKQFSLVFPHINSDWVSSFSRL